MKRAHVFATILLLTVVSVAQQPANPPDNTANPTDQRFTRPVETRNDWGPWGLLGLLGLAGLLGRRRETTITRTAYTDDDRTYRRPAA
jgi:MYXO-CTERM domain-containing protein